MFSSTSFWNKPLPSNTPVAPQSAAYVDSIVHQIRRFYGHATINTLAYAPPVWVVGPHQATVSVSQRSCHGHSTYFDPRFASMMAAVPIPPGALPAPGNDHEMVVWQPSTSTEWDLWEARKTPSGWSACWGGRLRHAAASEGIMPYPYGTTATGLPLLGGLITAGQMRSGHIGHALAISLVDTRSGVFSWPASRTDGWIDSPDAVPEGQRFRLDPHLDIASLHLNPVARAVAEAAQRYGLVVRDKSGSVALYAQSWLPWKLAGRPDPYASMFGKLAAWQLLDHFPWQKLQALPFDYGKPSGTPAPGRAHGPHRS